MNTDNKPWGSDAHENTASKELSEVMEAVKPKLRFRLCPELGDGEHHVISTEISSIMESVKAWLLNAYIDAGESMTIETVMMSDEEFEALKDV